MSEATYIPEPVKIHSDDRIRNLVKAYGYNMSLGYRDDQQVKPVFVFRKPGPYVDGNPAVKQACDILLKWMLDYQNVILYLPDIFYDHFYLINLFHNLPMRSVIYAPRLTSFPAEVEMLWDNGAGIILPRVTRIGSLIFPSRGHTFKLPTKKEFLERIRTIAWQVLVDGKGLSQKRWHTCETTHCIGGWAITNQKLALKEMERIYGPVTAAYVALGPRAFAHFRANNEQAYNWLDTFLTRGQKAQG